MATSAMSTAQLEALTRGLYLGSVSIVGGRSPGKCIKVWDKTSLKLDTATETEGVCPLDIGSQCSILGKIVNWGTCTRIGLSIFESPIVSATPDFWIKSSFGDQILVNSLTQDPYCGDLALHFSSSAPSISLRVTSLDHSLTGGQQPVDPRATFYIAMRP